MAKLNVNGQTLDVAVEADTPLLWVLREQVGLTGTKYGCGIAQCGACTVHIDGEPVRSCVRPLSSVAAGQKVVTIEGLAPRASHPLQKAWIDLDVPQCGFCQSGMLMAAAALLDLGLHGATDVIGGYRAWVAEGLPSASAGADTVTLAPGAARALALG